MPTSDIATGKGLTVSLELLSHGAPVKDPILGLTIDRASDGMVCYESTTEADGVRVGTVDGPVTVELEFERLDLLPGDYMLDVGIYRSDWEYAYDYHWHAYPLRVLGPRPDKGVFRPPHRWKIIH
jgi:lipopolysaccharide transport system ATP-binding protein